MRILQLCHKPPFPPVDGGCVAMAAVTKGLLNQGTELFTFSIATPKHPFNLEYFPKEIQSKSIAYFIDTNIKFTDALSALVKNTSYNISRFYNANLSEELIALILKEKINLVHVDGLYAMPYAEYIKANTKAKIVLRSHNIEHHLWQQKAKNENNPLKKLYLKQLANQLKEFELKSFEMADGVISISSADSNFIQQNKIKTKLITIPVGIEKKAFRENSTSAIYHIGAMDWQPNAAGLDWFLNKVWPLVLSKFSDAELHLAGRNMQKENYAQYKNVKVYGEVKSAEDFAKDKGIMIIPVHEASGIRIKLAEAMMMSKAIVSTSIGASGIENLSKNEILLADDAVSFSNHLVNLISDNNLRNQLSKQAHNFALNYFEQDACSRKMINFYKDVMN
jgi:glycosyltransferase involved in cell wall biosynthesis